jgi:ABC-type transporter Mla MlaB component
MEYTETVEPHQITITLRGDVTIQEAEELKQHFIHAAAANRTVAIDCSNITRIDLCILQLFTALEARLVEGAHMNVMDSREHTLCKMVQLAGVTTIAGWPQQLASNLLHGGDASWQK